MADGMHVRLLLEAERGTVLVHVYACRYIRGQATVLLEHGTDFIASKSCIVSWEFAVSVLL